MFVCGAGLVLLTGCEYPYYLKSRFNDPQLSCEEIEQQITETQKVIDRGFVEEYGPVVAGFAGSVLVGEGGVGSTLNDDRRTSRASAVERRKVLLSLRSEKCDGALSPANPSLQGTRDEAARP
jgi:hypothetical protein